MKKCIDVYTVDDTRREILLAHRPLKKNIVKSPTRPSNGPLSVSGEMILSSHRIQLQSTPSSGQISNQGNGNDIISPSSILQTVLHEDDPDIDHHRLTPNRGQSNNNNNLSSSEQDELPPKLPKVALQQPLQDEEEGQGEDAQEEESGQYQEESGQYQEEDGTEDMAMQESGHSLELDQEDGNSLDDAEELPLDERELMMESLDEGSSLLLPSGSGSGSGSGYGEGGYITSSPNKMSPLSRAAAIAAVSAASSARSPPRRKTSGRIKNWCCLKCPNCLADDCGKCINCLDRPKFGGPFIRKQRCLYKKCLMKGTIK